ncbi:MAG TPA: DUF4255 domain-containing protein [Prolixibacteraceae bacterium]|nr:DUF4255 domain-containing protein [Prolixibacteraceae bacterium]
MIYETLQILKEQLEAYFSDEGLGKIIILENIALWESGSDDASKITGKVVLTLINTEEEATLKNIPNFIVKEGKTEYKNPPVHLNLFLLISANCDTYDKSLRCISKIIQFFQGKKVFTSANTVYNRDNVAFDVFDSFKFIMELYSPTFEELNYVWGTLGGRQLPSAIYKIQLIQIEQDKKLAESEVIVKISGNLKNNQ